MTHLIKSNGAHGSDTIHLLEPMMKIITVVTLSLSLLAISPLTTAGPGHEHDSHGGHDHGPISSERVSIKAKQRVEHLIASGKIAPSWKNLSVATIEQKTYANGPEWIITFKNPRLKDANKQTLFLFFTLDGRYIAANYTGN